MPLTNDVTLVNESSDVHSFSSGEPEVGPEVKLKGRASGSMYDVRYRVALIRLLRLVMEISLGPTIVLADLFQTFLRNGTFVSINFVNAVNA